MASSAFSFHCMICFEEFDPQTNYPVVLPCGHTYVCIECANRLDKCMECRTPLTMKIELAPPPPPPGTPGTPNISNVAAAAAAGAAAAGGAGASPDLSNLQQKENRSNGYADRVRNSPGFRRRYGNRDEYKRFYGSQQQHHQPQSHPPQQPLPKQRLPLPKNAVLLSLIQASEPARRRAEVEAPPTPQKIDSNNNMLPMAGVGSETPSPTGNNGSSSSNKASSLPKFTRPSPLFLDGSSSGEHDSSGPSALVGSQPDDEEHKIRVGTYLEGGPCGTYAVASKTGLLVYPTLFEHTLPSALNTLNRGGKNNNNIDEEDVVKRDVEELVKKHRATTILKSFSTGGGGKKKLPKKSPNKKILKLKGSPSTASGTGTTGGGAAGTLSQEEKRASAHQPELEHASEEEEELKSHHTWVECHEDNENLEVVSMINIKSSQGQESNCSTPIAGASISFEEGIEEEETDDDGDEEDEDEDDPNEKIAALSDPGVVGISTASSLLEDDNVGLCLTISDDDANDAIGASVRTLPTRSQSEVGTGYKRSPGDSPLSQSHHVSGSKTAKDVATKFKRHFSQGYVHSSSSQKKKNNGNDNTNNVGNTATDGGGEGGSSSAAAAAMLDEFERPLIRLKYGDRVQVVSMDSRGWVKLARGYGYIRLENDKQLVKVGGTSDKACQIEAMLHELSIERNRLKHEQMKLERLSAGLMIDLQSSLITSDDHVVVPAPEGSLKRSDSEVSLKLRKNSTTGDAVSSVDDIDVSTRSRTGLTPPRSMDGGTTTQQPPSMNDQHRHREIRTAKSHSPGRTTQPASAKTPPSPPYGQVVPPNLQQPNWSSMVYTPTRVNFRTGLSGHRALTSSHSHPHDFIDRGYATVRSMSNHAGISSTKKASSRGRSIY